MNIKSIANRLLIIAIIVGAWFGVGQLYMHLMGHDLDEVATGPGFVFLAAPLMGLLFALLVIVCLVGVVIVAVLLWELVGFIEKETFGRLQKWASRQQQNKRWIHHEDSWKDER